jgi:hypothetical protein
MDQATRHRIAAEQLVRLTELKRGSMPAGLVAHPTTADGVRDVRDKYLSHLQYNLEFFFPAYWHHRRPNAAKIARLFDALGFEADWYENLDSLFEGLYADVGRLARPAPWHDLLLIERAIAKSRIARRVDAPPERFARTLRTLKPRRERRLDKDGVFFVWLTTDLITAFGYPGRDPRRAKPVASPFCVAIYRRPRTDTPELVWFG